MGFPQNMLIIKHRVKGISWHSWITKTYLRGLLATQPALLLLLVPGATLAHPGGSDGRRWWARGSRGARGSPTAGGPGPAPGVSRGPGSWPQVRVLFSLNQYYDQAWKSGFPQKGVQELVPNEHSMWNLISGPLDWKKWSWRDRRCPLFPSLNKSWPLHIQSHYTRRSYYSWSSISCINFFVFHSYLELFWNSMKTLNESRDFTFCAIFVWKPRLLEEEFKLNIQFQEPVKRKANVMNMNFKGCKS